MSKQIYLENLNSSKYKRPKGGSITSRLQTKEAMTKKLENYERADSVDDIELDRHVRYVTLDKDKKQVFRTGGLLIRKQSEYVQLSNGRQKWSVQRYHYDDREEPIFETVFFYRISQKEEFGKKEEKYVEVIKRQRDEIKKLKKLIKQLRS